MNSRGPLQVLVLSALLIWCVGIFMTAGTVRKIRKSRLRLEQKAMYWGELRALKSGIGRYGAALRIFEGMAMKRPVALGPLLTTGGLKYKTKDLRDTRECARGWTVRQKEIDFSEGEVALGKVMGFVEKAEVWRNDRPPWRLAKCLIRSSQRAPGWAHVVVVLEALEESGGDR